MESGAGPGVFVAENFGQQMVISDLFVVVGFLPRQKAHFRGCTGGCAHFADFMAQMLL